MFLTLDRISRVLFWGCVSGVLSEVLHLIGIVSYCWVTFVTLWVASGGAFLSLACLKLPSDGKAVLVSGCDSGFGQAAALYLHRQGFRVFAGCLQADTGEGARMLRDVGSDRLQVLQLDVTKQEEIDKAIKDISDNLKGKEVLWGVINNAGIQEYGAVEWVSMASYRKIGEVNIFGMIALTKACLPLVRKAKGRVVNVTSARGRLTSPLGTCYEYTKYAMEGFSDGLRHEMKEFGVNVSIIEPGNFASGTKLWTAKYVKQIAEAMWNNMDEGVKEDYGGKEKFDKLKEIQANISSTGNPDLTPVSEAMFDALTQRFPQGRYQPMDITIFVAMFISQHFPEWVYDSVCLNFLLRFGE